MRKWQIFEAASWAHLGPDEIAAEVFLSMVERGGPSTLVFVRDQSLQGAIQKRFPLARVSRGAARRMNNRSGDVEDWLFEMDRGRECMFFRQFTDTFADSRGLTFDNQEVAGNIAVHG